jgi:ribonuclease R
MAKSVKKSKPLTTLSGVIRMHPRGFGFVQLKAPSPYKEDIFIPKPYTKGAVDGDLVEIEVNEESTHPKGPEGRVVKINERSRSKLAGIMLDKSSAHIPLLKQEKPVDVLKGKGLKRGDRYTFEIISWGDKQTATKVAPLTYLGTIDDPSCDISAAIAEFELPYLFSEECEKEAKSFGSRVSRKEIAQREDLRSLETFTIDPTTAKDFDDALSLKKDKKGRYHLAVHIADVSYYVKPDSFLDQEAYKRANSVYFPGKCIPMLPKSLSENLCSLKADVNRLTVTVFMEFDKTGELISSRIARTVIKSLKRFTYKEAKLVIDGKKKSRFKETLDLMCELCHLLKQKRYERGSIEFALPELCILVDETGAPTGTDKIEYDISHQLVEEFMLKANETVAKTLSDQKKPLPFRVHEEPSDDNLRDFSFVLGAFGFDVPETPSPKDIQKVFLEILGSSHEQYLATSYIRRMRLAVYSPDNIGHYGLALEHYCHFTSPIRRYIDLVIHRTLFENGSQDLLNMTTYCSEKERTSDRAENRVILLKKLRYLKLLQKKDPKRKYDAIVTKVKGFGFFFELIDLGVEGFFTLTELFDDYYVFDEAKQLLRGRRTDTHYHAGTRLQVLLKDIDLITLETKWHLT